MFRYWFRPTAAWPNDWVLPSVSFGGAPGVFIDTLRRFAPENGWRIISDQAGPTCLFVQSHAPIIFVGLIRRG